MTLAELSQGESGEVLSVGGCDEVTVRLLEMGLTPGIVIKHIRSAPLGDPREFELRGYRLSLRQSEAARVEIVRAPSGRT